MGEVKKDIYLDAPVHHVYERWTHFEQFPSIMHNVKEVHKIGDKRYHWVAEIGGKKLEWDAEVSSMVPDKEISWQSTSGAQNRGHLRFESEGTGTHLYLTLEYNPPGGVVGDIADTLTQRMSGDTEEDLKNFKKSVEGQNQTSMR